jgi:hypothetical protein
LPPFSGIVTNKSIVIICLKSDILIQSRNEMTSFFADYDLINISMWLMDFNLIKETWRSLHKVSLCLKYKTETKKKKVKHHTIFGCHLHYIIIILIYFLNKEKELFYWSKRRLFTQNISTRTSEDYLMFFFKRIFSASKLSECIFLSFEWWNL